MVSKPWLEVRGVKGYTALEMEILRDIWFRFQHLGLIESLPAPLREPPGLWVLLLLALALVAKLLTALGRALLGGPAAALRQEARDLLRRGEVQEAGRAFEALGDTRKALRLYRQGNCHEDRALLLIRLGRRKEAKTVARDGGEWQLFGELCQEDGDLAEAAVAFERAGQAYLAGQCYAETDQPVDAARCYLAAGMEAEAVRRLRDVDDMEAAELLDQAVRSSLSQMGGTGLSLELQEAVQRGVQLWLAKDEAHRAFRLAVDSERLKLAVPVARDYLEPSTEAAEVCARAGAHRVAADIYGRLGETRLEALQRAEDALGRQNRTEAAEWFEKAEAWEQAADQWAAAGDSARAAELFTQAGDLMSAAQLTNPGATPDQWATQAQMEDREAFVTRAPPGDGVDPHEVTVPSFGKPDGLDPTVASRSASPATESGPLRAAESMAEAGDRYEILEELGRGGMGVVYVAEDKVLQRRVAYKVVPDHVLGIEVEPDSLLAEARAAARLSHPNIVQVYDAGRRGRGFYVVMELIRGQSLEQIVAEKQVTVAGALRIGLQICAALDHAHSRRIIHRDLKPSNLMWSEERVIKLADFGLARAFEAGKGRVVTQPAGTPSYMAPEQIRGEPVSPLADIYSFGCVLFELLCKESVFGTGPPSFHHHLTTPPRDPRELRAEVPAALAGLILSCLAKEPSDRPQSAAELGKTMAAILKNL